MPDLLKKTICWIVVLSGILMGILLIFVLADQPIPNPIRIEWLPKICAGCFAGVFLIASILAIWDRKYAAYLFLIAGFVFGVAGLIFLGFNDPAGVGEDVIAVGCLSGVPFLLGIFWSLTFRSRWPPLVEWLFKRKPLVRGVVLCILVSTFVFLGTTISALHSRWNPPNVCETLSWAQKQATPGQIAFVGKVVFLGGQSRDPEHHAPWAILHVERHFFGLHWWSPNLLLVKGYFGAQERGAMYLIDGMRNEGMLTRFLPVYEPTKCGRMGPIARRKVDMRILGDAPHQDGIRIIGVVKRMGSGPDTPMQNVPVFVTGPAGRIVTNTDQDGIYDLTVQTAGRYTVELNTKNNPRSEAKDDGALKLGDVFQSNLYLVE